MYKVETNHMYRSVCLLHKYHVYCDTVQSVKCQKCFVEAADFQTLHVAEAFCYEHSGT